MKLKKDNDWKNIKTIHIKKEFIYRFIKKAFIKKDNVWINIFEKEPPINTLYRLEE